MKWIRSMVLGLIPILFFVTLGLAQEDKIVQVAIETFKVQIRVPPGPKLNFQKRRKPPFLVSTR